MLDNISVLSFINKFHAHSKMNGYTNGLYEGNETRSGYSANWSQTGITMIPRLITYYQAIQWGVNCSELHCVMQDPGHPCSVMLCSQPQDLNMAIKPCSRRVQPRQFQHVFRLLTEKHSCRMKIRYKVSNMCIVIEGVQSSIMATKSYVWTIQQTSTSTEELLLAGLKV